MSSSIASASNILLAILTQILSFSSLQAEVVWECRGQGIQVLEINSDLSAMIGLVPMRRGDEEELNFRNLRFAKTQSQVKENLFTFLHATDDQLDLLVNISELSTGGRHKGSVFANNSLLREALNSKVECEQKGTVLNPPSMKKVRFSVADCADPNSDAGIAAWGAGICGDLPGGSN